VILQRGQNLFASISAGQHFSLSVPRFRSWQNARFAEGQHLCESL
jgi:hypothetical protein